MFYKWISQLWSGKSSGFALHFECLHSVAVDNDCVLSQNIGDYWIKQSSFKVCISQWTSHWRGWPNLASAEMTPDFETAMDPPTVAVFLFGPVLGDLDSITRAHRQHHSPFAVCLNRIRLVCCGNEAKKRGLGPWMPKLTSGILTLRLCCWVKFTCMHYNISELLQICKFDHFHFQDLF